MSVSALGLSTLRLPSLRRLSCLVGLNMSGAKPALIDALTAVHPTPTPPTRILSIDMGIRNLAYCVLDLNTLPLPKLTTWTRIVLPLSVDSLGASINLPAFAAATHTLATELLRDHAPSHILIERQRWRSQGGPGVQEWTIRVNTVEAMLHTSLLEQRLAGNWDGHVESVDPGRVARLWVPQKERTTAAAVKTLKKEVVKEWLRKEDVVMMGDNGPEMTAELLLLAGTRRPEKLSGERVTAAEKKVDDLADCLLQAVAWLRWQEGRRRLQEGKMPLELEVLPTLPTPAVPLELGLELGSELDHTMDLR
ncbi:mitochondrial resolvase Ydc2 [Tricharina praecox]|uniref:mitochondrial resolvase Ydc2 n=1 Tax=Tricharina praecox TaxID=43433 RepID=UPI00221FF36F|nr:mitochondrial resolvase Ydc2 [Tricharina praecox]KAI5845420.1 mitochondrial resolvase Ydc2 [Tricharina praecox]